MYHFLDLTIVSPIFTALNDFFLHSPFRARRKLWYVCHESQSISTPYIKEIFQIVFLSTGFGAGGMRFKSWANRIEHSVANGSPSL